MPRVGLSPTAGEMPPAPATAMIRTTTMRTITSTAAMSAAQAGLVYTSYTSLQTPTSGTYAIRPMYRAAEQQYQTDLMLINPMEIRANGYSGAGTCGESSVRSSLSTGYEEVGAVGGVPIKAVGYPEPDGHREYSGLGARTGMVLRCEQVTGGGYSAQPKEARTTGYYGYIGLPQHVVRADQATVSGRVDWASHTGTGGSREPDPDGRGEQAVDNGRCAKVDTARVAGSTVEPTSWIPSIWVGVEPAKL